MHMFVVFVSLRSNLTHLTVCPRFIVPRIRNITLHHHTTHVRFVLTIDITLVLVSFAFTTFHFLILAVTC